MSILLSLCNCPSVSPYIVRAALASSSYSLRQFVPIYLSMYVSPQDLLVWLSCRPQQTKNRVHYGLPIGEHTVPSRLAPGQRNVSLLSGCHVIISHHAVRVSRNLSIIHFAKV